MRLVDLRSDTLTRPTPAMRKAMAEAEVGDDAYGEDPTVNRPEALAAERLGFERALFLPSGTMANQVALLLHLPKELEAEARRYRKLLGGGWRQAGVLAAAGILALEEGPKHLRRDHEMARALAEGLFRLGLAVDLGAVETNMVYLEVEDPEGFLQGLRARGVLAGRVGGRVRFVTHRDLMDEDIPLALERVQDLLHSRPR